MRGGAEEGGGMPPCQALPVPGRGPECLACPSLPSRGGSSLFQLPWGP